MGLESTMICLDNSEWMRNGDYTPTRMEAQHDAANLISGAKTQANPESTVGVLTMAGNRCELLVSPTDDMSKILNSLHNVPLKGALNFCAAVQVAQLALKHRRNKHGGQRIIVFVGSPVQDEQRPMVKAAKLLKKNNVACDIVSMGELDENQEKLQAFIEACNSNDNSHLITIPAGVLPSDVLISSPIIQESGGAMAAAAAASATSTRTWTPNWPWLFACPWKRSAHGKSGRRRCRCRCPWGRTAVPRPGVREQPAGQLARRGPLGSQDPGCSSTNRRQ